MGVEVCRPSGTSWFSPRFGLLDAPVVGLAYDWSDSNVPWAYTEGTAPWEADLPAGVPVVNLSSSGATFWDRLNNTQNAQSGRFICRLPVGDHVLTSFRLIGGSGDPTYAFGFWFPKLAGFVGAGPDQTYITMAANSMTEAQLERLRGNTPKPGTSTYMDYSNFDPNQLGFARFDGTNPTSPCYIGGVTFRAADQNPFLPHANLRTAPPTGANVANVMQPAPHQGIFFYPETYATMSYVRLQAAGRAVTSRPPFEHGNITSQRCRIVFKNVESDGRRSPDLDPARPRRVCPYMGNNEYNSRLYRFWGHHSNVSRYAVNDENGGDTAGPYEIFESKFDNITTNRNVDPALNGGQSLGGHSNPSAVGFESTRAEILITDTVISQDNANFSPSEGYPQHLNITTVGNHNPSGGRMEIRRCTFRNIHPQLDGFLCMRVHNNTAWFAAGLDNVIFAYDNDTGARLAPWTTTSWPPSAATLAAAGLNPHTHYLVKTN